MEKEQQKPLLHLDEEVLSNESLQSPTCKDVKVTPALDDKSVITLVKNGVIQTVCIYTGKILNELTPAEKGSVTTHRYTIAMAQVICDKIREGIPLSIIASTEGMPPYNTICRWRATQPDFADAIIKAKRDRAELMHDKIIATADAIEDAEQAKIAKVKIDAYKWSAEKSSPEEYGKKETPANAGVTFIINTGVPNTQGTILEAEYAEITKDERGSEEEPTSVDGEEQSDID